MVFDSDASNISKQPKVFVEVGFSKDQKIKSHDEVAHILTTPQRCKDCNRLVSYNKDFDSDYCYICDKWLTAWPQFREDMQPIRPDKPSQLRAYLA